MVELHVVGGTGSGVPPARQCVYVIGTESDVVKIGIAANPEDRVRALQTGHHEELRLIATYDSEADGIRGLDFEYVLHEMLEPWHIRGEWFRVPRRVLGAVMHRAWVRVRHRGAWDAWWSYPVKAELEAELPEPNWDEAFVMGKREEDWDEPPWEEPPAGRGLIFREWCGGSCGSGWYQRVID